MGWCLDVHLMVRKNKEDVKSNFLSKVEMFNKILAGPQYLNYCLIKRKNSWLMEIKHQD